MRKSPLVLALMFSSLLTVSCGSDDDDNGSRIEERQEDTGKDLFSLWSSSTPDGAFVLDFREYSFDREGTFLYRFPQGIACSCTIEFEGTQSSGDIFLRDCIGVIGCNELNDNYSYEKSPNTFILCDSRRDCATFQ